MTSIHLNSADPAAQIHFWCGILEGVPLPRGARISGASIVIAPRVPSAGTAGCVLDHIGLQVKDLATIKQRLTDAGIPFDTNPNGIQIMVSAPDDVRVELTEKPDLPTAAMFHHYHYYVTDVPGIQRWYAETLGAVPGKRAHFDAADLPGVNFTFSPTDTPRAPTSGRALDHIALDSDRSECFIDPWGTAIELRGSAIRRH